MSEHEEIPTEQHAQSREELIAELEARTAQRDRGKLRLTPGIAIIGIFMLVRAIFGVLATFSNGNGAGTGSGTLGNYTILAICSLVVIGVFGMLGLRRWGWALVLGGCFISIGIYSFAIAQSHSLAPVFLVVAHLIFFLYLIQPDVRSRMR